MDVGKLLRPHELSFDVPKQLTNDINNLIAALEHDYYNLDAYRDEVKRSSRTVSEENSRWIRRYYVENGWMD